MSLVLHPPRDMHLCSPSNVPHLPSFLRLLQNLHVSRILSRCRIHCALQKQCLNTQSSANMCEHVVLDLETCFAPQLRALFQKFLLRAAVFCSIILPDGSAPAALTRLPLDPPEPPKHWKQHSVRDCSTFYPFRAM